MTDFILTLLFGWCGYYRFRNDQFFLGILYLFTFGLFGIGWIVDIALSVSNDLIPFCKRKKQSQTITVDEYEKLRKELTYKCNKDTESQNNENNNLTNYNKYTNEPLDSRYEYLANLEFPNNDCKFFLIDTELNYIKYSHTKEIVSICKNFVNKKIETGMYLEYYTTFREAIGHYNDFDLTEILEGIQNAFLKHNFVNNDVKSFFRSTYGINSSLYQDNAESMLEGFDDVLSNLNPDEFDKLIINQYNEFEMFITNLMDTRKIERSLPAKQSILILINKFYRQKLKKEYLEFTEKYNIDEKWLDDEIVEHTYSVDMNFDAHKLGDLLAIKDNHNSLDLSNQIFNKYVIANIGKEFVQKENYLKNLAVNDDTTKITIRDIDVMSGPEFEQYIAKLFKSYGYKTEVTKASGDQGIDVIAEKNGTKYAIQAKCYNFPVGNHAIMEAVAGAKYYDADQIMVITNNTFTKSAIELAQKNNVHLWDRKVLIEKISEGIN